MIFEALQELLQEGMTSLLRTRQSEAVAPAFDVDRPPPKISGDAASNAPLVLAKVAKAAPGALAKELLAALPSSPYVQSTEIAGNGFLNFHLTDQAFQAELESLLGGTRAAPQGKPKRVLIEFVSANPTGPLHVGHGRGAALGDSLARILRALGADVTTEFYVNDAGGQIRNLGLTMEARVRELGGEKVELHEGAYRGSYVIDLAKESLSAATPFAPIVSNQMIFSENDLAGFASSRILKIIQKSLLQFDVHFDSWFFESSLHKANAVPALFALMKDKGLAYEAEGALWFRATDFGDDKDRVLQKGNDAPTYFASDIAYHRQKFDRGFDQLVNIWGADHHGYAQRLKGAMTALGSPAEKLTVVFNQLVSLKGGRLSKRAGDMVTLEEVIDEVGKDATRFFFALRSPGAHFEFDLDLAKKQASDNPVFYVQYVHARCASILQEAQKRGLDTAPLAWRQGKPLPIQKQERALLLHLSRFEKILKQCANDLSSHHLTVYLMELAGHYHSFYESCRVLDDDAATRAFRLDLVRALKKRVAEALNLLGVSAPERL